MLYSYRVAEAVFKSRELSSKVKLFTLVLNVLAAEFNKKAGNCLPFTAPPFLCVHPFALVYSVA